MTISAIRPAYLLGARAFAAGVHLEDNPFHLLQADHGVWDRGWMAGLHRYNTQRRIARLAQPWLHVTNPQTPCLAAGLPNATQPQGAPRARPGPAGN